MARTEFINHAPFEKYFCRTQPKKESRHWMQQVQNIRNAISEYNYHLNWDTEMELFISFDIIWNDDRDVDSTEEELVCAIVCSDSMDNQWLLNIYG